MIPNLNAEEKIWASFQRIIELFTQKFVTNLYKIWIWDPESGKNLFRIPDLFTLQGIYCRKNLSNYNPMTKFILYIFYTIKSAASHPCWPPNFPLHSLQDPPLPSVRQSRTWKQKTRQYVVAFYYFYYWIFRQASNLHHHLTFSSHYSIWVLRSHNGYWRFMTDF